MQLHQQLLALFACLAVLAPSLVKGECCNDRVGMCGDGTHEAFCCGYGPWYVLQQLITLYHSTDKIHSSATSSAATVMVAANTALPTTSTIM